MNAPDPGQRAHDSPGTHPASPPPLALHPTPRRLTLAVALTYLRSLVALVAAVGLPLVPAVLLWQLDRARQTSDSVYVNGQLVTFVEPLSTPLEVALGVLGAAGALVGLIAGVLIAGAELLGHRIGVRQAWRAVPARIPSAVVLLAVSVLVVGLVVRSYAGANDSSEEGGFLVLPALFLWLAAIPVLVTTLVAVPVAVLERVGPVRAVRRAHEISSRRWRVQAVGVLGAAFVGGMAVWGALELFGRGGDLTVESPVTTAFGVLLVVALVPLVLVVWCAPVTFSGQFDPPPQSARSAPGNWRPSGDDPSVHAMLPNANEHQGAVRLLHLDLARVHDGLPAPGWARPKTAAAAAPALLAVLLVPPLIGPVTVTAAPYGSPRMAAGPVDSDPGKIIPFRADEQFGMNTYGEGVLITKTNRWSNVFVCDPECTDASVSLEAYEPERIETAGHGSAVREDGTLLYSVWREFQYSQDRDESANTPGLYLGVCEDPLACEEPDEGELIRPYSNHHSDVHSSVTPVEDGVVVASYASPREDDGELPGEEGDLGGLRVQVCTDTDCADPVEVELPGGMDAVPDLEYEAEARPYVDVAGAPGGGFTMAFVDRTSGAVWIVGCEETECTSPIATQVIGDQFSQPNDAALAERIGARVEYRSDGTPVVAHRHADGSARVLDCADPACAEAEEHQIADAVWTRPLPGFDLDSQDRPQLLTADYDSGRLLLVSCLDTGCAETVETPLSPFDEVPLHTALTMDGQDRPHLLSVGAGLPAVHAELGPPGGPGEYVRCSDPWCGADLD